jgi:multicomponent Na+:H+ antiporter subunit D
MIKALPPAAVFIMGAFLIPFLKGRLKSFYMLALPAFAYLNLLYLPAGQSWEIMGDKVS